LERWLLHRLARVDAQVRAAYEAYQFRDALSAVVEFCNVDLSAFYVDVRKDALYCDPPRSDRRRASRTALDETFSRLTAWLAPLLPFTTEEAWRTRFPEAGSVHLRTLPPTPEAWLDEGAAREMEALRRVRSVVTGALEIERREKRIGSSLEAAPEVYLEEAALAEALRAVDFAELCITSDLSVHVGAAPADAFTLPEAPGIAVRCAKAQGRKCARSWRITQDVGADPRYPDLSARDAEAVALWDRAQRA
jgi:isoleucyl-tRNA synthetase